MNNSGDFSINLPNFFNGPVQDYELEIIFNSSL